MSYPVTEALIGYNRSYKPLRPQGFVIHATATKGASDENERNYFNSRYVGASVHYFADWDSITRTVPENEIAWHAGPTANSRYLSVEMCEPAGHDVAKFQEVWNRTVWLVADACVRYGWKTGPDVWSHNGISQMYHETDHTDPIQFLAEYGRTWGQLLAAIDAEILRIKGEVPVVNTNSGVKKVKAIVTHKWAPDAHAAAYMGYYLGVPVLSVDDLNQDMINSAEYIVAIGGSESQYVLSDGTKIPINGKIISGSSRYDTADKTLKFIIGNQHF